MTDMCPRLLAQTIFDPLLPGKESAPSYFRDLWFVFGAIALVAAAVFIWAYFFRKRRSTTSRSGHHSRLLEGALLEAPSRERVRKRRRHRIREHRPRNPSLNETGGLPPARKEGDAPRY